MRIAICFILPLLSLLVNVAQACAVDVEQWGQFEVVLKGPATGNPFIEVELSATFTQGKQAVKVNGFYDGGGTYRVRFMPVTQGDWTYVTMSNNAQLNAKTGKFTAGTP